MNDARKSSLEIANEYFNAVKQYELDIDIPTPFDDYNPPNMNIEKWNTDFDLV